MNVVIEWILRIIEWPPIFNIIALPGFLASLAVVVFAIWFERKAAARVQMRYGPLNISPRIGGFLQLIADLTRFAFQEIIVPEKADYMPFIVSPIIYLVSSVTAVAAIPATSLPQYHVINSSYTMLIALAILSIPGIMVLAAAWASNNKFSLIGGVREAYVIASCELPVFISALAASVAAGTLCLTSIVGFQKNTLWLAILDPPAAVAFFIAVLLSTSKFPFEIPEAESEIVAGPFTEYSALLFGLSMGGGYIKSYVYNLLFTVAFLGGWLPYEPHGGFWTGMIIPAIIVFVKAGILTCVMAFMRSVFPRYRIDQAIRYSWKYLIPLSLAGVAIAFVIAAVASGGVVA